MNIGKIWKDHKLWLSSNGKEGVCADFSGANFSYANFRGTNKSFSQGADFSNAQGIRQWQAPQGERRFCYSVKYDDCVMHKLGYFWGKTDEAVEAIRKKYGEGSLYEKFLLVQVEALESE